MYTNLQKYNNFQRQLQATENHLPKLFRFNDYFKSFNMISLLANNSTKNVYHFFFRKPVANIRFKTFLVILFEFTYHKHIPDMHQPIHLSYNL